MAGAMSLRERKKQATRQAIEDAAWELYAERGYAATSVDDIAARADVAPRTFFRYFRTKEDTLYGEFDHALDHLSAAFRARPVAEPVFTSLIAALAQVSAGWQKDRKKMIERWTLQKEAGVVEAGESIRHRFVERIADLVREREADNPDGELIARVIAGTLVAVQSVANDYWLERGATESLHDVSDRCMSVLLAALGPTVPAPPA